jgi:putative spermidine/putrescine transport system substrate-binding protein
MRKTIANFGKAIGAVAGGTALALSLASPAGAAGEAITVVSWGGAYQKSQDEAYFKPFQAKYGAHIGTEEYNGEIAKIRAMVESGNISWDVIDVDSATVLQGCEDGLFLKLDWKKIGDERKFVEGTTTDCGVGTVVYSTVFAYDADKLKDGPTTVADLFDLKKFPGKRALWKSPVGNLEYALMADGVPRDKVYAMLKTPAGIDRAFKKLDTIKSQVVWWEAGAQPPQLLASGEVVMTTAWNGRIFDANKNEHKNFKIVWDGQMPDYDFWVIVKGSKHVDEAYKFVAFASSADAMANQSKYISYGPTNVDAIPKITPAVLKDLPTAPENNKTSLGLDASYWADHGDELRKRFNTWLAQ